MEKLIINGEEFSRSAVSALRWKFNANALWLHLFSEAGRTSTCSVDLLALNWGDESGKDWLLLAASVFENGDAVLVASGCTLLGEGRTRNESAWAWQQTKEDPFLLGGLTVDQFEDLLAGDGLINKLDRSYSGLLRNVKRKRPRDLRVPVFST